MVRPQLYIVITRTSTPRLLCARSCHLTSLLTNLSIGVKSYDVSLESQAVTVVAGDALPYETVLKTIKKTGKKVNSGEADGETKSIDLPEE